MSILLNPNEFPSAERGVFVLVTRINMPILRKGVNTVSSQSSKKTLTHHSSNLIASKCIGLHLDSNPFHSLVHFQRSSIDIVDVYKTSGIILHRPTFVYINKEGEKSQHTEKENNKERKNLRNVIVEIMRSVKESQGGNQGSILFLAHSVRLDFNNLFFVWCRNIKRLKR